MALVGLLLRPRSQAGYKLSVTQAAITGTGAITTGLSTVLAGGAVVSCNNSATSATADVPEVTSVSGGTVNVAVSLLTYTGPTIALETVAKNINCIAVGT
jgi:hypothetical protein